MRVLLSLLTGIAASSLAEAAKCNHDNCLRAFIRRSSDVAEFCKTIAASPMPTSYAPFITTACTGNAASRATSACACIMSTNSSSSEVLTSSSTMTTTTTTTVPTSTTSSSPSCTPGVSLVGASETGFNAKGAQFSLSLSCGKLDTTKVAVYANMAETQSFTAGPEGIVFPAGFTPDSVLLSIFALTTEGMPIIKSFRLLFGTISMPVLVLGPGGTAVPNALVITNATGFPGVGHACNTDGTGRCVIENLPPTTVSLVAKTADNLIAVNGLAANGGLVTLQLLPYVDPEAGASFDVDNGTSGWTGGNQMPIKKRDMGLVVSTNGQATLQSAAKSFPVKPFTKNAYIKYKFITSEVPGGFFGSQYNDYYSVTIRSDTGALVSVTNSMNALGLGAFDAQGATDWYTLTLPVPSGTKSVRYNIGVSNVADRQLDSSVVVQKVGDQQCENCGDCSTCPTDPMCQPACRNPPLMSCSFYRSCAEGQLDCGPEGYALAYGEKNCLKISSNVGLFSPAGQSWVWDTMNCLQRSLVPVLSPCTATCGSLSAAAFASHTPCYVENGICSLPCQDLVYLFMSVGTDLFTWESVKQAFQVAVGCLQDMIATLQGCGGEVAVAVILALLLKGLL